MPRYVTPFFALLATVVGTLHGQDTVRVVSGRVRDAKARKIAGVEVLDPGRRVIGTSDADGWFSVTLSLASQTIGFRRVGYRPAIFTLSKTPNPVDTVTVMLAEAPQILPDLTAEVKAWKPVRYAGTLKYDDVFRRRRLGLGTYISREEIDRIAAINTLEYLQGVPGVRVTVGPPGVAGASNIRITRCNGWGSKITVYVDGSRVVGGDATESPPPTAGQRKFDNGMERPVDVIEKLSRIAPSDIEMIEVFRGASQLPAEFHDDGCAAIAIWTRWNAPIEKRDTTR